MTGPTTWMTRSFATAACAMLFTVMMGHAAPGMSAQADGPSGAIPDLNGIWDGSNRSHPTNGLNQPWGPHDKDDPDRIGPKNNEPELNERAKAYLAVFDEVLSPKYDCQPASQPGLQYDPYMTQIIQWPDRVIFRYEKDDQVRTVWLDGRKPTVHDYAIQGFSVGRYDGNALLIETTHFVFDVTGFDDMRKIPSSQQKRITERYWRDGDVLRGTVTVEDPIFLKKPASFTTRWLPAPKGYQMQTFECDPEAASIARGYLIPKYKD